MTTELTRRFSYIAIEDINVPNLTASATGDVENPGINVKAKAGLNREILNVTPGQFRSQLEYKALKTGSNITAVDPKNTSQICSACDWLDKQSRRSQSVFQCTSCGYQANADINAARNILKRASSDVPVRRKSPSEFLKKSATTKANVSCFQPASVQKINVESNNCSSTSAGHRDFVG